jgi:hypothetical protein
LDAEAAEEAPGRKALRRNIDDIIKRRQQRDAERAKFRKNARRRGIHPVMAVVLGSGTLFAVIAAFATFQKYFGRHRRERLPGALRR